MKLSKLTLACLLATSGLSATSATQAAVTDGFEFHGYFRAGVLLSSENDFKRSNFVAQKETLGRLGLEADNDASLDFVKKWSFDDGKTIRINVGLGDTGDESSLSSSADAYQMGVGQTYVEFTGVTSSGKFWGGTRDYGKDNYIFMTDLFYTDMSGTGIGIEGYEVGDLLFDAAYIASDRIDDVLGRWDANEYDKSANLNNLMHAFNLSVNFGSLELSALYKVMPDNWDENGYQYAEVGGDLTAIYNLSSFFFIPGNGFSKIIAQAGVGLGSGNLLGGTITSYNAYHPGSQFQGEHNDWAAWHPSAGDAQRLLTYVDEKDTSARLLLWGGYFLENGISFFPSIQGQYNDHDADGQWTYDTTAGGLGAYDYWVSAMVRSNFPVADNFFVSSEIGTVHNNWNGETSSQSKITVAPTWIIGTGQGPAPEIRLLASYIDNAWGPARDQDENGDLKYDHDIVIGMQADMWW
ncbi:MAG: maltoporin [Psychromonas sp.]|jgi:maltoporin|uniref:carbohydrate porin n=1 Tax=Psychromonas sp. TaxID=1884585 RepID=UPI0039E2C661